MTVPKIESYRFGHIEIDGVTHHRDVILLPGSVQGNWRRKTGHRLYVDDLEAVWLASPKVLVVGLGASSQMSIPSETLRALEEAGIELIALPTEEACKRYNALRGRGDVAAALHLTC